MLYNTKQHLMVLNSYYNSYLVDIQHVKVVATELGDVSMTERLAGAHISLQDVGQLFHHLRILQNLYILSSLVDDAVPHSIRKRKHFFNQRFLLV